MPAATSTSNRKVAAWTVGAVVFALVVGFLVYAVRENANSSRPATGRFKMSGSGQEGNALRPAEFQAVVGMKCEEAKKFILEKEPGLLVQCIPFGSMVTMDYSDERVRVFHDTKGVVVETPRRG
ncbi:Subtilisin-chymotrypsin inhibitor-2A [Porphyridium purpureum]|uniref:Subtilisin-chymotrypsin inhibitor-2A n=1 Tax=Porphyridium purpureum TaxID=35688 RepID=A0A5J4Z753_PORPP|nr:Subtilisin-chymotrypsin inhibitor-2A [Porphyridium purpureum]|eukprot:POR2446..scf295_1